MTTIFLARHAETDWNREHRWQGHADPPLNRTGLDQAWELSQVLEGEPFDAIYSSDLRRAYETADAVAKGRGLEIIVDTGLREPLPVPLRTSLRYARARHARADVPDALEKAGYKWRSKFGGERDGGAAIRIWGTEAPIPGLTTAPVTGEEFAGETTRFGALALRVWSPLIQAEQGGW